MFQKITNNVMFLTHVLLGLVLFVIKLLKQQRLLVQRRESNIDFLHKL